MDSLSLIILFGLNFLIGAVIVRLVHGRKFFPNFFKEMPPVKRWFCVDNMKLVVTQIFLFKSEEDLITIRFKGFHIIAYLLVRILAFVEDLKTSGSESGIVWSIKNAN